MLYLVLVLVVAFVELSINLLPFVVELLLDLLGPLQVQARDILEQLLLLINKSGYTPLSGASLVPQGL